MGDRVSRSDVQDPVLHVFERLDDPGTPLSRSEIASELNGRNIDVQSHLDELNRSGRIKSKIIDDTRLWWLPPGEYRSEIITGKRVLEHAAEAIFVTDPDGTIDYVNPAFERITGYDRGEVLGRTPEILKSGVQNQSYYTELWETILDGAVWEEEIVNKRKNGDRYTAHQTITPITTADGSVRKFLAIQRDVTDRRRLREELRGATAALSGLYEITLDPDRDFEHTLDYVLQLGSENLGLPVGYVTKIEDGTQTILARIGDVDAIRPGRSDPLEETFCREAIERDEPFVIDDIFDDGWQGDPAYDHFGLRCYVGARIVVDDEVFGTLCFGSDQPQDDEISATYQSTVKTFAQWIGHEVERRRYDGTLRRQNDLFQKAQDMANVGAWEYDVDSDELHWTAQVRRIHGVPDNRTPDVDTAIAFFHPTDRPWLDDAIDRAISEGNSFDLELRLCPADGGIKWVRVRGEPQVEYGSVTRIRGTIRDIEERMEREAELEQSKTRFRTLFEQSPDAIVLHDLSGNILEANQQLVENLGYSRGSIEAMQISDFETDPDGEYHKQIWAQMDVGETRAIEGTHRRKDGSTFPVEVWLHKIEIDGSKRIISLIRDVSEREERERQLRVLNRVLRHNLSNDMNVIKGFAETIREECTGRVATDADRIVEQSDNLLETIQKQRKVVDVLSERPQHQQLDAVKVIRRVGSEYTNLEINIDLSLPERAPVTATSDLSWAVTELVENAIVHNETDRPAVRIEVVNGSDTVKIRISDTGPTIPDIDRAVLTGESKVEPLFHGRGMGLWLVYWIVRRSEGSIAVASNDPEGNTIEIELSRATE